MQPCPTCPVAAPALYHHGGGSFLLSGLALRHESSIEQQPSISVWFGPIWAETRTQGRHSAVLTRVMTNKFMDFDTLTKHCLVKRKKKCCHAFCFCKGIWERFQDWKKKNYQIFGILATLFSVDMNTCQFSKGTCVVAIKIWSSLFTRLL